eukprot:gb/GFBE01057248.1/.p1 GENE.gb/GFBE01057248.1/~~gb/GFBE01057248.1/.p1  ORF type:complete len:293 (+),score=51.61 gb/GFBE01057248.1/:1-879(+)
MAPSLAASPPPGLSSSDAESATRSRERRQIALAWKELGAEMKGWMDSRFEQIDGKINALFNMVAHIQTVTTPPSMPGNLLGDPLSTSPMLSWCYWYPCNGMQTNASPNVEAEVLENPVKCQTFDMTASDMTLAKQHEAMAMHLEVSTQLINGIAESATAKTATDVHTTAWDAPEEISAITGCSSDRSAGGSLCEVLAEHDGASNDLKHHEDATVAMQAHTTQGQTDWVTDVEKTDNRRRAIELDFLRPSRVGLALQVPEAAMQTRKCLRRPRRRTRTRRQRKWTRTQLRRMT